MPRRQARPVMHLAARFCAKEAVAKALGLTAWSLRDVEVVATDAAPEVRLSGSGRARAAELGVDVTISLTHTDRPRWRARVAHACGDWRSAPSRCPTGSTRSTRPRRCAPSTPGRSRSRAFRRST